MPPQPWTRHFWNLSSRSWNALVAWMGTTTPAIIVSVLIILTVFVISTGSKFKAEIRLFYDRDACRFAGSVYQASAGEYISDHDGMANALRVLYGAHCLPRT